MYKVVPFTEHILARIEAVCFLFVPTFINRSVDKMRHYAIPRHQRRQVCKIGPSLRSLVDHLTEARTELAINIRLRLLVNSDIVALLAR